MNWFDLIFSDQPRRRYRRHAIFWITWWLYFAASILMTQQGFNQLISAKWIGVILIKSLLLMLGHAFMVYSFIYFILPRYLLTRRWESFTTGLVATSVIIVAWSYFCYALLFQFLDSGFGLSVTITQNVLLWTSITGGLLSAVKVVAAAAGIKLLKRWWLKQKENQRLEKEKIAVELQLLKAQIHPDVLFSSLDHIYSFAVNDPAKASELLLILSDLLSYILYECDQPKVRLEKELKMIRDYMTLEKARLGARLEMSISVKGETNDKMIAPLLLLPFVENSLSYCGNKQLEKAWINLDIRIEENELSMKLVNGKSADQEVPAAPYENGLGNVNKRLHLLYPGNNELRIYTEPEIMMTFLKIRLEPANEVNDNYPDHFAEKQTTADGVN